MKSKTTIIIIAAITLTIALISCKKGPGTAVESKTFRAGAILALTGPNAEYGLQAKRGIELAREDIQRADPGAEISVQYEDSESTPTKSVTAYQKLVAKDGLKLIFGNASFLAKAVSPLAENDDVLFIALGTTMPGLVEGKVHTLRHFPTSADLAPLVAAHAKRLYGRVAVLYVNDEYGKSAQADFRKHFESPEKQITISEGFDPKSSDVRSLVDKALAGEKGTPEAIYVPGYGPAFSAIIKRLRETTPALPILGDLALVNANVREALGNDAEGIVVPAFASDAGQSSTPKSAEFIKAYKAKFSTEPDIIVVSAYDSFQITYKAFKSAGAAPQDMRGFIIKSGPHETINGPVTYTEDGDSRLTATLLVVRGGKLQPLGGQQ
jgi:branched-chain amino acid transport system substrate-binding protein